MRQRVNFEREIVSICEVIALLDAAMLRGNRAELWLCSVLTEIFRHGRCIRVGARSLIG